MALTNTTAVEQVAPSLRKTWWKESTVYQIYPASFKDSNGDGLGDIPGIISELDYIKSLGVDIVWLSPILKSPQVDMGYDISDYKDIHAPYGSMADHDALIKGLHDRGLKYVMDLVVNHTSSEHEWFKQSRSSKDNKYRDWYIWRPATYSESGERIPPNNWEAAFSGSVWEWDEATQEYYLHLFAVEQPDLNWENPDVVAAVHEIMSFWLDRGVDGFRMDVINFISKAVGLPDATITKPGFLQSGAEHFSCGPRLHEFFQGMGKILKKYDAFSVGEMPGVFDTAEILKAVGQDRGELAMAFNFEIVDIDSGSDSKWTPYPFKVSTLKGIINKWQTFMQSNGGWNALYMENHDQSRTVSRYCSDAPEYRTLSSKMIATLLALQSGTVFVYQGQELAMASLPKDWPISKYKDLEVANHWAELMRDHPDDKELQQRTLDQYRLVGRDNARTPMQWSAKKNAGFTPEDCTVEPWMDFHPDFETWNAANQVDDPDSAYNYWKSVLALRKQEKDVFVYGVFDMVDLPHEKVVAYTRTAAEDGEKKVLVVINFSEDELEWTVPEVVEPELLKKGGKIVLKNYKEAPKVEDGVIALRPFEAVVWMSA